MWISTLTPIES